MPLFSVGDKVLLHDEKIDKVGQQNYRHLG
jgi:hypothetical protein